MTHATTIALTVRADMQDEVQGFLHHKTLPGARVRLGDGVLEHRFTRAGEQHQFVMTQELAPGEHDLTLEFMEDREPQGALEVRSLRVQGNPMGLDLFRCTYRPWKRQEALPAHLYMGWPGTWSIEIQVPTHTRMGGVGFD